MGPPGEPGPPLLAAVVTTDGDGRARWDFPRELAAPPVIGALPVSPNRRNETALSVVLEEVTSTYAVVRVWRARPRLGLGLLPAEPAGAGVQVHVTTIPTITI
ncbi:hypothetical protein [Nonomuraea turcica]|uniref:hypothetical protein n=1 Tax=Nonomuraea sp. G32 TaxID=3067274 RepID=UPI00273B2C29|nr:hypothetical protein [Nonomuraea sp. G32]